MNGTCIETAPQKVEGEDEPYVFTFFTDISANPDVIELVQTIQNSIKNTLTSLTRYLIRWKKYRGVWKVDKVGGYIKIYIEQQYVCEKPVVSNRAIMVEFNTTGWTHTSVVNNFHKTVNKFIISYKNI